MRGAFRTFVSLAVLGMGFAASAQITVPMPPVAPQVPGGVFNAFPAQNPAGPRGVANQQSNYPYEGQCLADSANNLKWFPLLQQCDLGSAPSFACVTNTYQAPVPDPANPGQCLCVLIPDPITGVLVCQTDAAGQPVCQMQTVTTSTSAQSADPSAPCGGVTAFKELTALPTPSLLPAAVQAAVKYQWEVLNPPAFVADTLTYPGADYYELRLHEAWGFNDLAGKGLFPNAGVAFPNGMQWTGIRNAAGTPLPTPIWGVGAKAKFFLGMTPSVTGPINAWSDNDFFATWPAINVRATAGRPVVVKWINEFPNNHVFCPHPEAADWPCAIDRTFMGVKAKVDPALAPSAAFKTDVVNEYGSPQQPDNSWVTHLHGGDIPPSTDGFAELWFGNKVTAAKWAGFAKDYVSPPFENPSGIHLSRPVGVNYDVYTYPMMQEEATIWYHDHTLGKTHHNVIAGPAGFFPVYDPKHHSALDSVYDLSNNYACTPEVPGGDCAYAWLDILSRGPNAAKYDLFLAVQDRAFNSDGSINFSNGLGQNAALAPAIWPGLTSVTPGVNPEVHPTWVPEYFGEYALVNGVAWPKRTVEAGWTRLRFVNGSDSRCYTSGFSTIQPAPGAAVTNNVPFYVIANDQGYLRSPVLAPGNVFTMCPGERYEILIDFSAFAGLSITMTNTAGAPFPLGLTPQARGTPWPDMNQIMQFRVGPATTGIKTCVKPRPSNCLRPPGQFIDPNWRDIRAAAAGAVVRQMYLNEKVDGTTLAPLGMQLNGVPFEYRVTETPRYGTTEVWQFINLTVDAHPMHPHLVKHQIISRQNFNVGGYKALLCGSTTCQPGPAPGNEMQVVPDVTPLLANAPVLVTAASIEGGWKDASAAPPGMVTTIIAEWKAGWPQVGGTATAPGTAGGPPDGSCPAGVGCDATGWTYESVTSGPYVWHCHINSHEDSEMMRTSLVVQ